MNPIYVECSEESAFTEILEGLNDLAVVVSAVFRDIYAPRSIPTLVATGSCKAHLHHFYAGSGFIYANEKNEKGKRTGTCPESQAGEIHISAIRDLSTQDQRCRYFV